MRFKSSIHHCRRGQGARRHGCSNSSDDERCPRQAANVARFDLGSMSMASAGRMRCADSRPESPRADRARPGVTGLRGLATRLLAFCALSCAIALAGCAQHSAQREPEAARLRPPAPAADSEPRIRWPSRALLSPQPAPDCEFKRSDLKTVDPEQWARLKLDYERQCYQRAEKVVRDRLRRLQASSTCQLEPARHPLGTTAGQPRLF
jgi:hypothetical protein